MTLMFDVATKDAIALQSHPALSPFICSTSRGSSFQLMTARRLFSKLRKRSFHEYTPFKNRLSLLKAKKAPKAAAPVPWMWLGMNRTLGTLIGWA
jgi:hypothetical protein